MYIYIYIEEAKEIFLSRYLGLDATKPSFGVSDKARLKPDSSATETLNIEISPIASSDMMRSNKRITKTLIRLRGCAGWSAPLLFANRRRQVFSRRDPFGIFENVFLFYIG